MSIDRETKFRTGRQNWKSNASRCAMSGHLWVVTPLFYFCASLMNHGAIASISFAQGGPLQGEPLTTEAVKRRVDKLRKDLGSNDFERRAKAADELRKIGRAANDAIPELFRAMLDPSDYSLERNGPGDAAEAAGHALEKVGSPSLILECINRLRAIGEKEGSFKNSLFSLMCQLYEPGHRDVDEAITKALSDRSAYIRFEMAHLLSLKQIALDATLPQLIKMLKSENERESELAAGALLPFGPKAKDAMPQLWTIVRDEKRSMLFRNRCLAAIASIGRDEIETATRLRRIMRDTDELMELRLTSVGGLRISRFRHAFLQDVIDFLLQLYQSIDRQTAADKKRKDYVARKYFEDFAERLCVDTIAACDPTSKSVRGLTQILRKVQPGNREIMIRTIAKLGPDGLLAVPTIFEVLNEPEEANTVPYADALTAILEKDAVKSAEEMQRGIIDPNLRERYRLLIRELPKP